MWLRVEGDDPDLGWPTVLAELQEQRVPLPPGLAVVDLRWWQDQILAPGSRVRLPSLAELAKRWGWGSKDRVQRLLRREDEWSDPLKLDSWRARRLQYEAGRQRDDSATTDGGATPDPAETRDDHTTTARRDRDDGAYRRGDPPSPSPQPAPRTEEHARARDRSSRPPTEPDPLVLAQLLALQQDDEPQHGLASDRDANAVRRALLRGVPSADLHALWAWSAHAPDPDAEACRRGGWRRWGSLLRQPLGEARLTSAAAWDRAGRPRAGPVPPRRGMSTAGDGVLDEVLRRQREREVRGGESDRRDAVLAGDRGSGDPAAVVDAGGGRPVGAGLGSGAR